MNSSIYSADRATHLRILVVALAGSLATIGMLLSSPGLKDNTLKTVNAGRLHSVAIVAQEARPVRM
jgi:hypothetical protein